MRFVPLLRPARIWFTGVPLLRGFLSDPVIHVTGVAHHMHTRRPDLWERAVWSAGRKEMGLC